MPPGRPREFDIDQALERAMVVFWRRGYEGASLDELTREMGVSRPSLYAAFGNKEGLFRQAVERYAQGPGAFVREALEAPTAREAAERLLRGAAESLTNPDLPRGCMAVHGALVCSEGGEPVKEELRAVRCASEALVRERFRRAVKEGDLPKGTDAAALARYIATVNSGLAVMAVNGATKRDLLKIVETAMRAWPG